MTPLQTARVSYLEIQIQYQCQYEKQDSHNSGRLYQRALHGTSLIPSPVGVCHTGNASQSLGLSFLHQNDDGQSYTINNKKNR